MHADRPQSLYKYFSQAGLLRFLVKFMIRFTPPCAFNDPFEVFPAISGDRDVLDGDAFMWERLQAALAISFGGNIGMLCLSESPLNLLMWGHYASAHQGGVVEFDATHPFFSQPTSRSGFIQWLKKVDYSLTRAALPFEHFQRNKMGLLNDHGSGWLDLLRAQHPLFYTKSPDWSYEQEWRLVRQLVDKADAFSARPKAAKMFTGHHLDDDYVNNPIPAKIELARVPPACIKSIYLGAKSVTYTGNMPGFEERVWALLSKRPSCNHVRLNKVQFDRRRFSLAAFDLRDQDQVRANVSGQEFVMRQTGMNGTPFY